MLVEIKTKIKAASLSILAIIIITITVIVLGTAKFNTPYDYPLVQLDSGWTISRDGKSHPIESLSTASIGLANKGDEISVSTTIPYIGNIPQTTLEFRSILSTVDVYIDDELIYSYGYDYTINNLMLPKFHHFIPLPKHSDGKTIEIVFTATEDNAFSSFSPFYLGSYKDISNKLLQPNRLPIVIGNFLCMFGFVLLVLSPFLIFSDNHDYSVMFSALISIFMGFYILCYNDILWYVSNSPAVYTFLEYVSLFLIPPCIIGFIISTRQVRALGIGKALLSINLAFVLITFVLHATNLLHICHFVTFFHLLVVCEALFFVISLVHAIITKRKKASDNNAASMSATMLIVGLICFLTCAITDIILFNLLKYGSTGESSATINFTTVGALLFMICLFLNYFYHCIEYISELSTKKHLEGLAYSDSLTGLSNRTKCELVFAELKGDYTVISLDLDYLKYTNDNYGHLEGDKLISGFGNILKNSFTDACLVGRMGGDEFIVILPYIDTERTERDLSCMSDLMAYESSREVHIKYSASWGYANSKERDLLKVATPQKVYLLADSRMYEMKKSHHDQSLSRLYDDLLKNLSGKAGDTNNA